MPIVLSPMFISSRLMAAIKVEGGSHELDPPGGVVHIHCLGREAGYFNSTRVAYGCVIEDSTGEVLYEGDGIRSGVDDDVDYRRAMATTLHFIAHDGETYRSCMGDWSNDPDDQPLFNRDVAEWAYLNSDEITMLAYDLDPDS